MIKGRGKSIRRLSGERPPASTVIEPSDVEDPERWREVVAFKRSLLNRPRILPQYLNYKQAAEYLAVPVGTLRSLVSHKRIPHVRLGPRTVTFDVVELDRWLDAHRVPCLDP
jgi:excisionase family DNA binding protein